MRLLFAILLSGGTALGAENMLLHRYIPSVGDGGDVLLLEAEQIGEEEAQVSNTIIVYLPPAAVGLPRVTMDAGRALQVQRTGEENREVADPDGTPFYENRYVAEGDPAEGTGLYAANRLITVGSTRFFLQRPVASSIITECPGSESIGRSGITETNVACRYIPSEGGSWLVLGPIIQKGARRTAVRGEIAVYTGAPVDEVPPVRVDRYRVQAERVLENAETGYRGEAYFSNRYLTKGSSFFYNDIRYARQSVQVGAEVFPLARTVSRSIITRCSPTRTGGGSSGGGGGGGTCSGSDSGSGDGGATWSVSWDKNSADFSFDNTSNPLQSVVNIYFAPGPANQATVIQRRSTGSLTVSLSGECVTGITVRMESGCDPDVRGAPCG